MIRLLQPMLERRRLTTRLPIWVSRPEADGRTYAVSVSAWQILLLWLLFFANALVWGSIGIYEAVRVLS